MFLDVLFYVHYSELELKMKGPFYERLTIKRVKNLRSETDSQVFKVKLFLGSYIFCYSAHC